MLRLNSRYVRQLIIKNNEIQTSFSELAILSPGSTVPAHRVRAHGAAPRPRGRARGGPAQALQRGRDAHGDRGGVQAGRAEGARRH